MNVPRDSSLSFDAPDPDADAFNFIGALAMREAGLMIPQEKATMVFARLNRRLSTLGVADYTSYCKLLQRDDSEARAERKTLISVLTTNITSFLREAHHFDMLRTDILPGLIARARAGGRVRLWSAGCSSGQEAYTIAMCVHDAWPEAGRADLRILATDIDFNVLKTARAGVYGLAETARVPDDWKERFFEDMPDSGRIRVRAPLRDLVTFRELNLIKPWPFSGKFDVIFCRNVVIYFDQATQNHLWPRFEEVCQPGGTLFVGHSERVDTAAGTRFEMVGTSAYRKPASDTPKVS